MAEFAISMQILLLLLTVPFLYFIRLPPLPWALPVIGYLHHVTATKHKSSSALRMSSGRSKALMSASVQLASTVIGYLHHVTATKHKSSSVLRMSSGRSKPLTLASVQLASTVIGYLHHVTATKHKSSSALRMSSGRSKALTSASVQLASVLQNPIGDGSGLLGFP
jgi:hypothetical protein